MGLVINLKADTGLVDRSENTTRFYNDIKDYEPLTAEEEITWFKLLREGTPSERKHAREHIIKCNQRLVIAAAKKYSTTDTLMDFTNEANVGLMQAIDKFDYNVGVKFASYAMWFIKRAINTYINQLQLVKRTNSTKTFHVISKATNKFIQENERNPTADELMEMVNGKFNKDIKDKNDLLDLQISRIDYEGDDDVDYAYGDIADYNKASASYNTYEETEFKDFNTEFITQLLDVLNPREREIIKMRFGISDTVRGEAKIHEIALKMNLTKERVRQLEKESLEKMKREYIKHMGELL